MNASPAASPATIAALELPVPERNGTRFVEREAQPVARQAARAPERLHHEVRRVGRQHVGSVAEQHDLERPVDALDHDVVAQRQRDTEAVVAGPEIGRRRRRGDVHAIHRRSMAGGGRSGVCSALPT